MSPGGLKSAGRTFDQNNLVRALDGLGTTAFC